MTLCIFPRCEQNWPPDLARKYVNLRRESPLSDKNLKLILARYRKASGLWEEAPNKERTWKARTLSEFLTAKHLDLACAMIRADLQDNLGQACDALRSWQEDEYRLNFLVCARDVLEADIKEGSSSLLGRARFNEDPTSFLIVGFNRPGAQDIRDQMREKIQMDLTEYTGVLKFCQNKKIDTKQLFGFSEEEIQGWHQAREKEYQETINDWKNLL